jgi:hypothetical protein
MIHPGQTLECTRCGEPFTYWPGKPGRITECATCAHDVEPLVASDSDADGEWSAIPRSKRRHFHSENWFGQSVRSATFGFGVAHEIPVGKGTGRRNGAAL